MRHRHVIRIEQHTRDTDPTTRQPVKTWETFRTTRGTIADAKASERTIPGITRDVLITHTIRIPSNSATRQIKPNMRAISGGVTYNIEAATDPQETRRELILQVTAVTDPR